jgi:hypothetical protein
MSKNRRTKKISKDEHSEINHIIDHQLGEYKESFHNGSISSILRQIHIDVKCKSENQKKLFLELIGCNDEMAKIGGDMFSNTGYYQNGDYVVMMKYE